MIPTSPPVAVAIQHSTGRRTSLDVPDVPLVPSPSLVLFPTESHSSMLAPTAPNPSHPRLSSAPDLDASAEGEGSANVALKERAAHDSPLTTQENTIAAPDLPPQSPSPLSITDIASASPSPRSPDVEHTGDHSPHPSYGQYDIIRTYRKIWGDLEQSRARCNPVEAYACLPHHINSGGCYVDKFTRLEELGAVRDREGAFLYRTKEIYAECPKQVGSRGRVQRADLIRVQHDAYACQCRGRCMVREPTHVNGEQDLSQLLESWAQCGKYMYGVMYRQEGGAARRDKDKSYEAMGVGASDGLRTCVRVSHVGWAPQRLINRTRSAVLEGGSRSIFQAERDRYAG
ncbi:hypothetical protein EDB83DRAFT_2317756 [Lactarius deliciosus]|nr:hypothetical protein EDB83DRAFT_2317756 [Lactarius deliciosus]